MSEAPRPADEQERLRELHAYAILDTPPEPSFDRLARLASSILDTPLALISLIDDARQWCKATVGSDEMETSRAISFCAHVVHAQALLEVRDTTRDPRFQDNPRVVGAPGVRFYTGAPLTTPAGFVLGTICGLDTQPRDAGLTALQRQQLTDLAALVVDELELRRSVRLLGESQRELAVVRLATDAASDAIIITDSTPIDGPDGPRIVYANRAFLTLSGYDHAEVIGRTPRIVQGPDTDRDALDRIREAVRAGRGVQEELLNYRKDGTPYWVDVHIAPVLGRDPRAPQLIAVQRDVTERRALQQALIEREARYRLLFERNPQCMWVFDAGTGRFLDVNDAALAMYGYARDEFLEVSLQDIGPEQDVPASLARLDGILDVGRGSTGEWRHRRKDGSVLHVRVQSHATTHRGTNAVLALVTDISAELALEEQLREAQKMEAVGTLAGGLAHDFNNLLTVINGYADMVASNLGADDPSRHDIGQIQRAGDRAATLTQQLLALSSRQVMQPARIAAAQVITDLQPMLARMLRDDIELSIVASDCASVVVVDPSQLELVVLNLVVNAAEAMPDGGRLVIDCREVELTPPDLPAIDMPPGTYLLLSVSDTGVGMDEATLGRVFEPFFSTKPRGRGAGLGLPTAFGIVKQSRGHLSATSEPGAGSTFRVYLPVDSDGGASAAAAPTVRADVLDGTETVLVVEDNEGVREFVATVLADHGYQVLTADDGPTAFQVAAGHDGRIDLVLSDMVMPRMDGREVAGQLRREAGVSRVLYMSGCTEDGIVADGVMEPGIQYVAKPFGSIALLEKVRETLDRPALVPSVVVADDETHLRRLLSLTLARSGYEVYEARHGGEALALCREHRVDLLLTDLVMPEQEGLETIRELRRELPHVRIVAMSGAFDGKFLDVARAFGADAVLQKPFDSQALAEAVTSLIGRPAASAD